MAVKKAEEEEKAEGGSWKEALGSPWVRKVVIFVEARKPKGYKRVSSVYIVRRNLSKCA